MTDCDASVVASQSAVLFGLVAIAAVGLGLGWKGFSFEFLCGFCLLTDWTAFSPERGSTLSCSVMGRKTEGGAMGNAARCVGRCSVLRRHLQRPAAFDRECCRVAGIAEGGDAHPPAVRHGALLYWSPNAAGILAFAPRNIGLGGSSLFRHAVCRLQGRAGGVLPLLLGCLKKKAWHTPWGAAMLLLGWAIRFRTRTKTTKMSCATITP